MNQIQIKGIIYNEVKLPEKPSFEFLLRRECEKHGWTGWPRPSVGGTYVPDLNLEAEFELIQDKQSKLSRRERDWVEAQFHRKYKTL